MFRIVYRSAFALLIAASIAGCKSNDTAPGAPPIVSAQEQSMIVDDPREYRDLFQRLQRATFVRQGLDPARRTNTVDQPE